MRKFQFRLATLARLREAVRDQRRGQLADALGVQTVLEDKIGLVDRNLAEARELQTAPVGAVDVDRLLNGERYELVLQAERQGLTLQLAKVTAEVVKRREALVAADQDVKALEKLRATQHEEWRQQSERETMRELDEVAGRTTPAVRIL
jgi:flagellar export protein FliJ